VKIAVLFLGNPIFKDDAIGIEVGKRLVDRLEKLGMDVFILERTGLSLLDYILGYERVVIVDSFKSNQHPIGDVYELPVDSLTPQKTFSPHYAGLPEALMAIHALKPAQSSSIHIIAIETNDPYTISEEMSVEISNKLETIVNCVFNLIIKIVDGGVFNNCSQA
jgi:hydrogenase maturation protease